MKVWLVAATPSWGSIKMKPVEGMALFQHSSSKTPSTFGGTCVLKARIALLLSWAGADGATTSAAPQSRTARMRLVA